MKLYEFFGVPTYETDKSTDSRDKLDGKTRQDDEKLADEVYWYMLDDDDLHKQMFMPLAQEMIQKMKSKTFDREEEAKKWLPMVNAACMKFYKETEMTEDPKDVFSKEMRLALCKRAADQHFVDLEKGEYKVE